MTPSHLPRLVGRTLVCLTLSTLFPISPAHAAFSDQSAAILGGANFSTRSASLADIDNDGDLDLLFQTSGAPALFRNNFINAGGAASLTFTNVSSTMLPSGLSASWSAAWGDYNGDGKVDVFIGQTNSGSTTGTLLKNNGAAGFSNAGAATGLNAPGFAQNVAWGDFNNDHRLDLVIGMEGPVLNQMYLQQAAGTFTPVGAAVGIQTSPGMKSYGMAIGDYDGDGDSDIYISTCTPTGTIRNNFYKNMLKETSTLSFVDVADSNGTQNMSNTYGAQFTDMDDDGRLDLIVAGADGTPSKIYRNDGNGSFTDVDTLTGHPLLTNVGTDLNGLKLVDYDNDGKLDLYFHDNLSGSGNQRLYHNEGNWQFNDVTTAMGLSGLSNTGAGGYDSTWGDINLDGAQDLIDVNNLTATINGHSTNTPEKVFINDAASNGNHWLYVKLAGPSWDTTGIGSSLYATLDLGTAGQVTLRREANTDADTFNQSNVPVHFGLAAADHVDWLRVVWPDGVVQYLHNVAANQYLTLSYSTALSGDFNGDGLVDGNDFAVWQANCGAPFTIQDFNDWKANYGHALPADRATANAVPEPATFAVLITALAACCFLGQARR
jgi:hypothetical protein